MDENKEKIEQNNTENVVDDIQYTFVVPKGEIYREPEDEEHDAPQEAPQNAEEAFQEEPDPFIVEPEPPVYAATGLPEDDDIVYTFVVPKGEVYREPEEEDPKATIAVPAGNENASRGTTQIPAKTIVANAVTEAAAEAAESSGAPAETIVVEKDSDGGKKTRYGLPVDHPEMGELAQKQEARRLYKERKKNRFRTRFYVIQTTKRPIS